MKHFSISFLALAVMLLASCGQQNGGEYESTDSGLQYKYINRGEGEKAEPGKILSINMSYKTEDDSVLFNTAERGGPVPIQIDTNAAGMIYEGFAMLQGGDSVEFKVPAQDVFVRTFNAEVPPFIDSASTITFNVGVDKVMSEEDFQAFQMEEMKKQREAMIAQQSEQMEADSAKIEEYLEKNNVNAKTTESGVRYVVTKKGKGVQPSPGDSVVVHYRGKLLDGTQFDSSYDRNEPFTFPIGQGMVIPGWDEGIAQLNEGSKATLYIPSPLAYGPQGAGNVIEPNSVLIFDVELLDVKEASNN